MARFEEKSPGIQNAMNEASREMWGRTVSEAHATLTCVRCGKHMNELEREDSEYLISGLCSPCFDSMCKEIEED